MIVLLVCIQQIAEYLLTNYLVGDNKLCVALVSTGYCNHAEVIEQAYEIVRVTNILSREPGLQGARNITVVHEVLDYTRIMGKLPVSTNKHAKLVVVYTDVLLYHIVGYFAVAVNVVVYKIKHHIGIVHRGLAVGSLGKTLAKAPRTNKEEEHIGVFYLFDKSCLVDIITISLPHINEVHHAVGYTLGGSLLILYILCHNLPINLFDIMIFRKVMEIP